MSTIDAVNSVSLVVSIEQHRGSWLAWKIGGLLCPHVSKALERCEPWCPQGGLCPLSWLGVWGRWGCCWNWIQPLYLDAKLNLRDRVRGKIERMGFSGGSDDKESTCNAGALGLIPGWEDPWRRAWQPTPGFLPGESPWMEEPGGLQSTGSQRAGQDWATTHTQHRKE